MSQDYRYIRTCEHNNFTYTCTVYSMKHTVYTCQCIYIQDYHTIMYICKVAGTLIKNKYEMFMYNSVSTGSSGSSDTFTHIFQPSPESGSYHIQ